MAGSGSRRLVSEGRPNRLSREGPLVPGGGGNDVLATGDSVAALCKGGCGARATEILAAGP